MKKFFLSLLMMSSIALCAASDKWASYKNSILPYQQTFQGWCSKEKAFKMMDLILETRPSICVEIGVFGGSSVYPTAAALCYNRLGAIYAIDPWSTKDCLEGYEPSSPHYIWWSSINLDNIFNDFVAKMKKYNVYSYCHVMRMTSEEALSAFADDSIDILHIDGNHTEEVALRDIIMYFPKVKSGGYIWFDDVNWDSTAKAVAFLNEQCNGYVEGYSMPSCMLFRKP